MRAGAAAMAACVVLRELAPFRFAAPAQAMSWIPFAASLGSEHMNALLELFRKAYEYGVLVWLLRGAGLRYWTAGGWVAAVLVLLEMAQRYQPNRQPEITDALIAAILACILWGSERRAAAIDSRASVGGARGE